MRRQQTAYAVREIREQAHKENDFDKRLKIVSRVSTRYAKFYRIHKNRYIKTDNDYPLMWKIFPEKLKRSERYSPSGKAGFYFGITIDAALDEQKYYSANEYIDPNEYSILIFEMCLNDILYLLEPAILDMVWRNLALEQCQTYPEMYSKILDESTNNEYCNKIGDWARDNGYNGIIFPSARYADKKIFEKAEKENFLVIPEIDYVDLGTFFCGRQYAFAGVRSLSMQVRNSSQNHWIIYTQPNLVLFDDSQLVALKDRFPILPYRLPTVSRPPVLFTS